MNVTLLGTGSALPSPERVQAGVLVERDDRRLLVDCGGGVCHRLAQVDVAPTDVDAVLLTHTHLDHVADLPSLAKARVLEGHPDLAVAGPPGTDEVLDHLLAVDDLVERTTLEPRTITGDSFQFAGFEIEAHETRHSKECYAYRFGDRLAISGDTAPHSELIDFADGVDALIHECAYADGTDTEGHTTPSELGRLLSGSEVDRVSLTHLFPAAERATDELAAAVERQFDGAVVVATDLTEIP